MQNHFVLRASTRVAAVAATGLVAGSFAVLSAGTAHAESAALTYTCEVPILGEQEFTVVSDTNSPAQLPAGKAFTPVTKATVNIPESVSGLISGVLEAKTAEGTAAVDALVNGAKQTINMVVPVTQVPTEGGLAVPASGKGKAVKGAKAGSLIKMEASDFSSHLVFKKEDGSEALTADIPCTLNPGQNAAVDTIKIVKAGSKTTVKPTFMRKVNRLRTVSTVKANTGIKAPGKVKVVVKRNGKQIRQKLVAVKPNGNAPAVFAKMPKKGNFVIISRYMGSPNVKVSQQRVVRKLK